MLCELIIWQDSFNYIAHKRIMLDMQSNGVLRINSCNVVYATHEEDLLLHVYLHLYLHFHAHLHMHLSLHLHLHIYLGLHLHLHLYIHQHFHLCLHLLTSSYAPSTSFFGNLHLHLCLQLKLLVHLLHLGLEHLLSYITQLYCNPVWV